MLHLRDINPKLQRVKQLMQNDSYIQAKAAFEWLLSSADPSEEDVLTAAYFKERGDRKFIMASYLEAIQDYLKAASFTLGFRSVEEMDLPTFQHSYTETYQAFFVQQDVGSSIYFLLYTLCINSIAFCWMKLGDRIKAMDWLQELEMLYKMHLDSLSTNGYPWKKNYQVTVSEYTTSFMTFRKRMSDILLELGNTAAAAHIRTTTEPFGVKQVDMEIDRLRRLLDYRDLITKRHPDFKAAAKLKIIDPDLQLRGAWERLYAHEGPIPKSRAGFSSWIWNSRFYIYGGAQQCTRSKILRDLWCVDLRTMISWRKLPSPPQEALGNASKMSRTRMSLWNDDAWLFFGHPTLLKFNMRTETWASVETKSIVSWPYQPRDWATSFCMEAFEGKLYVFGGEIGYARGTAGINVLAALDLHTLEWTLLGGSVNARHLIKDMPTIRKGAASWVVPEERRMYILYGSASPGILDDSMMGYPDYQQDDMWSYSFDENRWRRERLRGNYPSPRSNMACAYNSTLKHVVVFGGSNALVPTQDMQYSKKLVSETIMGDTFVLDMKTLIWKQVLTRNFPHHREYTMVNVDGTTGKVYLYGGSCSSILMPSKHADNRRKLISLGDLWELKVDVPGGNFNEEDFNTNKRVTNFGPWKFCFVCRKCSDEMFACGGTCGGRIFLCSVSCQKKCWKEHKRLHYCRKF